MMMTMTMLLTKSTLVRCHLTQMMNLPETQRVIKKIKAFRRRMMLAMSKRGPFRLILVMQAKTQSARRDKLLLMRMRRKQESLGTHTSAIKAMQAESSNSL